MTWWKNERDIRLRNKTRDNSNLDSLWIYTI